MTELRVGEESETGRLEAFSDGVIAVIITIMVLEVAAPAGAAFADLVPVLPKLGVYLLSFLVVAVYWNNHHHLLKAARVVTAPLMWSNAALLFFLSLVPFATSWLGEHPTAAAPIAVYGVVAFLTGAAYGLLVQAIVRSSPGRRYRISRTNVAKSVAAQVLFAVGVPVAFVAPVFCYIAYAAVTVMWIVPERGQVTPLD